MTRTLWIAALAGALACFIAGAAFYATTRVAHGTVGVAGWFILLSCGLLLWTAVRYLRFRIRERVPLSEHGSVAHSVARETEVLHG
jgi:hypothetical protein